MLSVFHFSTMQTVKEATSPKELPRCPGPRSALGQQSVWKMNCPCSSGTFAAILMTGTPQSNIVQDYYTFKSPTRTDPST